MIFGGVFYFCFFFQKSEHIPNLLQFQMLNHF